MNAPKTPIGSLSGSQVSVPALTISGSQVSVPAQKTSMPGSQVTAPAKIPSPQVSKPAPKPSYPQDHCRNYLPHIENKHYQMITFRLNDSVPKQVIEQWKASVKELQAGSQFGSQVSAPASSGSQVTAPAPKAPHLSTLSSRLSISEKLNKHQQTIRRLLKLIDQYEDAGFGQCLLRDDSVAKIVCDTLYHNHQKKYELICWCIMPNHVHTLIAPVPGMSLSEIMYDWKSYTTYAINKALKRKGKLWMMEYFDRYIRDNDHFDKVVNYIHNNPVKAKFVDDPSEWHWCSANPIFSGSQDSTPGSQVATPAKNLGSQVTTPAKILDSQVTTPAQAINISPAGLETCETTKEHFFPAGPETCEPTSNEKQQSL